MSMKICTFNVRGLGNYMKRKQVFNWLNLQKYDICLLQETHLNTKQYLKWTSDWDGRAYFSGNTNNSAGVCF